MAVRLAARERAGVGEDRSEHAVDREGHRVRAAGERGDDAPAVGAGDGPREHGARADFVPGEPAEGLSEPVERLLEERGERLVGLIAGRQTGAARRDDGVGQVLVADALEDAAQLCGLVWDDGAEADGEPGRLETIAEPLASLVVGLGARVADGEAATRRTDLLSGEATTRFNLVPREGRREAQRFRGGGCERRVRRSSASSCVLTSAPRTIDRLVR